MDTKPLSDLDKRIDKAKKSVNSMGKYVAAGFAAAAYGLWQFTEAASHADETLNVIEQVFRSNKDAVLDWSKTMSKELGRSEYMLQEAASQFGAFLDPMFKGTDKDISKMSEQLAGLAVDLASFYDTSDQEAQMRLKSGISGETEAVRKLGIDISDSALRKMHDDSGAPGQYKSLSQADKTWLRFQKILQDTTNAQGDSARTAKGWANSLKRMQGRWQTFTVETGRVLKDTFLPLLHEVETWMPTLESLVKDSDLLGSAFRLAVLTTGVLVAAFAALNAPLLLTVGLLGGLMFAFEDLQVFLEGGTSVLGEFITNMTGVNDPLELWNRSVNQMVGGIDVLTADFLDLADNIAGIVTGGVVLNGLTTKRGDAARFAAGAMDRNREGVQAGLEAERARAAANGDTNAFAATFKGRNTLNSEQLTEKWNASRKFEVASGHAKANLQDVASGLVSNDWLVAQARERVSHGEIPNADEFSAVNTKARGNAATVVNIRVDKLDSASEEQKQKFLDEVARQTAALLREQK